MFIIGVLFFLFGCVVSIALHELGHLIPGKIFKLKINQYMIGFGPKIFSKRTNFTEYGIRAIPLGGYIIMAGMYPPDPKNKLQFSRIIPFNKYFKNIVLDYRNKSYENATNNNNSLKKYNFFYQLSSYKKIIIMLCGPCMNLLLGILLIVLSMNFCGVSKPSNRIAKVYQCLHKNQDNNQYSYMDYDKNESCSQSGDILSPAAKIGLQSGDRIIEFSNVNIQTWEQLNELINQKAGQNVSIKLLRDKKEIYGFIQPIMLKDNNHTKIGFLGISPEFENVQQSIFYTLKFIFYILNDMVTLILNLPIHIYNLLKSIVFNEERELNGPMSIIGAGKLMGQVASTKDINLMTKVSTLLNILGTLNLGVCIFNLIPILPFDGGHIVSAVFEMIRNMYFKYFSNKKYEYFDTLKFLPITYLVTIILIIMSIILICADLLKPLTLF